MINATTVTGSGGGYSYFNQGSKAKLAAALAAVQAKLPTVAKKKTAEVKGVNRQGERFSYTYKYADYADVAAAVLPLLGEHGLAFTCQPTQLGDRFVLAYQLIHESGETIEGFYPLDASLPPQQIGGLITYARRYALTAVTGIAAEEDDDAQGAQHGSQSPQEARRPVVRDTRPQTPAEPQEQPEGLVLPNGQIIDSSLEFRGKAVQPEVQALADLAFLLVRQHAPVADLQTHVYDVAKANRGWLTSPVMHPLDKTPEALSAVIRDAKGRLQAIMRDEPPAETPAEGPGE